MQLSSIFVGIVTALVATSTSVFASPVSHEKRDVDDILDSIVNLQDKLMILNTTAADYDGGLKGLTTALKIQGESSNVQKALQNAVDVANDSPDFNDKESQKVAETLLDFKPQVISTIGTLVKKEPVFRKGVLGIPLTGLVKKNLEDQHELSTELGKAITKRLTDAFAELAPAVTEAIDKAFKKAIKEFS